MSTELTKSEFTPEEAKQFTEELRNEGEILWEKFHQALNGRIWIALGYPEGEQGWHQYLGEHFPNGPLTPPRDKQLEAIQQMGADMSNRSLASVLGLDEKTIRNRKKELAEVTGADFSAPGEVRGLDGKTYAASRPQPQRQEVEAEIVIHDEQPQARPYSPAPAVPEDGTPLSERPAGDFGLAEIDIDLDRPTHHVSAQTVRETIRNYAHTGSSGLSTAKKGATDLAMYLTSGLVTIDSWNEGELSEVAEDTADTVKVLSSLLKDMADGTATRGMSRRALLADDTMRHLQEAVSNLSLVRSVIEKEVTA